MSTLTLAVMYLVPLAALAWLYSVRPGYALIAAAALGVAFGVGGLTAIFI